jgi:hypothetical protein
MPGLDGTGPRGMGPMTGGGRGFCSPRGTGAALRPYGFRRRAPYAFPYYGGYGSGPLAPRMTREQEMEFLRNQAQAIRDELKEIEARIQQIESKE